ncbi:arginine permease [Purpureocillium lavendulum]|uniref:Arginine permease n=1 Tax=Purpureocillium lavendulum TaxID=1247861 RepID=A0AB34G9B2_9HYPO|nr:arginine permease [Purpureocillium lavendulum]
MAEEGGMPDLHHQGNSEKPKPLDIPTQIQHVQTLSSPIATGPPPPLLTRRHASLDLDDYFTGPRDIQKHSKWPIFMQMHGSILPKLILPLFFVSLWASAITAISQLVHDLGINSVLLTVLGFVVGLGLSFRNSTAYERYAEGRKYWASVVQSSQILGRVFWIHAAERDDQDPREQMLRKLSAMNLIVAFAVSLKHSLRFEPYTAYPDLQHLIAHLDTFARAATETAGPEAVDGRKKKFFREVGEYLGVSFAASNPRKTLKRATQPLGNLPLEILNHIAVTIDMLVRNDQLRVPMQQTLAYNNLSVLNDALTGTERVLCTPLPIAYTIAIAQITWLYVAVLPFQLVKLLGWIAIPATIGASFIILGLLFIGREIENPFGQDVNDLPLDSYCEQIASDMDIIAAYNKQDPEGFLFRPTNLPLYPISTAPVDVWMHRSEDQLRDAIKTKSVKAFEWRKLGVKGTANNSGATSVHGDHNV